LRPKVERAKSAPIGKPSLPVRTIPPCAVGEHPERLFTGEGIVEDEGTTGYGTLSVDNGTQYDAVVRLAEMYSGRTARFVYIQARDSYTLTGIEPGFYYIRFLLGRKLVTRCVDFLEGEDSQEFERAFSFAENDAGDYIEYDKARVTLYPVLGGNAKTRRITRKRFLEGDQHFVVAP
jgi:hypothetical protein